MVSLFVKSQSQIAVGAFEDVVAPFAHLHPVKSSPVQKEEGLFPLFDPQFDRI